MLTCYELFCPDGEQRDSTLEMPPWVGQVNPSIEYAEYTSRKEVTGLVSMLSAHLVEHMARMRTRPWMVRIQVQFSSRSLLEYFKEIIGIPFPHCVSTIVASNHTGRPTSQIVFTNSERAIALYRDVLDCHCAGDCAACQNRMEMLGDVIPTTQSPSECEPQ